MTVIILLLLLSGLFSLISKNPIISVFFLILTFFYTSIIFIYFNLEFLAFMIIIIYVGALIMLFLFVIMMLNLRAVELYNNFFNYFPIACYINLLFYIFILFYFFGDYISLNNKIKYFSNFNLIEYYNLISNIYLLGELIYGFFNYLLIIASLILLVSMIGSIILTLDVKYYKLEIYSETHINILNMLIYKKKN